jgi:hypothetical protein
LRRRCAAVLQPLCSSAASELAARAKRKYERVADASLREHYTIDECVVEVRARAFVRCLCGLCACTRGCVCVSACVRACVRVCLCVSLPPRKHYTIDMVHERVCDCVGVRTCTGGARLD